MIIAVHTRGVSLTKSLRDHVHKRLGFTLGCCGSRVRRVDVTLADINGPRGGIDKRCLLKVKLPGTRDILIEDIQTDIRAAVDRAASRAGRTLTRRLNADKSFGPQAAPIGLE